ncbi:MAG: iron chelate uptake ABC transporter family permease subunit [Syntrophobacteraceae bacterium]
MISLVEWFIHPLGEVFFQKALIGSGLVAIVCGAVGSLVVLRRMAFLGDALSHAMIAGVAGGYLFMKMLFNVEAHAPSMLIGSIIAAFVTVLLIGFVARFSRVKEDSAIGIMYTGIFAAGVVLVSVFRNYIHIDLMHFIMGDVLAVSNEDLWASAIAAVLVLSVIILFFRYFQLASFDPAMAASIGMPVMFIDYVFTTCVSLVVVSAVTMVGVILVIGLLITPAATAYLLSDRLDRMMVLSALFGTTSVIGGLYLCLALDSSGGGAIILFCTLQFLAVMTVAPRYGLLARWFRLRQMVPQQIVEDILSAAARKETGPITVENLRQYAADSKYIDRALRRLVYDGHLERQASGFALTEKGHSEATRVLRAHRLWETYLHHVGTPAEEIHPVAHRLEHISDVQTVEYLDDLLIHPEVDPHGKEIPQDPDTLSPDTVFSLSLLRPGRNALVHGIVSDRAKPSAPETDHPLGFALKQGERISVESRDDQGTKWVIVKEDGERIVLDHKTVDSVLVRAVTSR